jgi:hypothetical protein
MSDCNDLWCENYGKGSEQCNRCVKKNVENEPSQLQVLITRQVNRDSEKHGANKSKGQER